MKIFLSLGYNNFIMKRIIWLLIFAACSQLSFSQDIDSTLRKMADLYVQTEIMGVSHLYKVDTVSFWGVTSCLVVREDTIYTHQDSNIGPERYQLGFDTYETLCEIVGAHLSGNINLQAMTNETNMSLTFISDMSGVIKKISFIYDTFLNIPIPLLETMEEEIKSRCRVVIDKKSPALTHANYVTYGTSVFLKEACY